MNNNCSMTFWLFSLFLSIDETVEELDRNEPVRKNSGAEKEARQEVEKQYNKLSSTYSSLKDSIRKKTRGVAGGLKVAVGNLSNIARNAFDNTVGYGIAKYQNSKSVRTLRNDPQTTSQIVYLGNGLMQNEGSQWRLAKQLRKAGKTPIHLKMYHALKREEHAEKLYQQVKDLHEKTNIQNAHQRNDIYSGHSSGADMGIYLAGDSRTPQHGIKLIQARAPAPTGIKAKTFGQRILMPLAKDDNVNRYEGRRSAVEMSKRTPVVPVQVLAGEEDRLVLPEDTAYQHAADHAYLTGPDSTHFGTSGGNKEINEQIISHLDKPRSEYKPLRSTPANTFSLDENKSRRNEQGPPEYKSEQSSLTNTPPDEYKSGNEEYQSERKAA